MPSGGSGLRFGVHAGQQHSDYASYRELWLTAERLGLDWASVFDHFLPIQSDPTGPCFEGYALLAALAEATTTLRCGIVVTGVTYRHPAVVANAAATIDHISGGRVEIGLGAAWYEAEHDQYGIEFPPVGRRMDLLEEAATVLKLLWSQPRASFEGRHFRLREALCEPKPVQASIPLWIGGSGERRTLPIVARHADGWNTFLAPLDQYRHKLAVLDEHCRQAGRDPADIRKAIVANLVLAPSTRELPDAVARRAAGLNMSAEALSASAVTCTPAQCVELLTPYLDLGVGDVLALSRPPLDETTLELLATEVAPALRAAHRP